MALRIWRSLFGDGRPRSGDLLGGAAEAGALRRKQSAGVVVSDHATHSSRPSAPIMVQESGRSPARDRFDRSFTRGAKPGAAVRAAREPTDLPRLDATNEREATDDLRAVRSRGLLRSRDRRNARCSSGDGVDPAASRSKRFSETGEEQAAGGADEEMMRMQDGASRGGDASRDG